MNELTKENIVNLVIKKAKNNITLLFDFDNIDDKEFKATYGYTKKQIKQVVEERF